MCRGDLPTDACENCVRTAIKEKRQLCPDQILAILFYDACIFRYSNQYIFSILDQSTICAEVNTLDNADPQRFEQVFGETMDDLASQAANDRSGEKFATKEANVTAVQKLYGLAECTPDLTSASCSTCLRDAISNFTSCCQGKQGARVLFPSCHVQYENFPFYSTNTTISPSPSTSFRPLLPPPPPPPSPPDPASSPGKRKNAVLALLIVIAIVVANAIAARCLAPGKKSKEI